MAAQILTKWAKKGLKLGFFCHFFKCASLVFLEIAYSENLLEVKPMKKIFRDESWAKTS